MASADGPDSRYILLRDAGREPGSASLVFNEASTELGFKDGRCHALVHHPLPAEFQDHVVGMPERLTVPKERVISIERAVKLGFHPMMRWYHAESGEWRDYTPHSNVQLVRAFFNGDSTYILQDRSKPANTYDITFANAHGEGEQVCRTSGSKKRICLFYVDMMGLDPTSYQALQLRHFKLEPDTVKELFELSQQPGADNPVKYLEMLDKLSHEAWRSEILKRTEGVPKDKRPKEAGLIQHPNLVKIIYQELHLDLDRPATSLMWRHKHGWKPHPGYITQAAIVSAKDFLMINGDEPAQQGWSLNPIYISFTTPSAGTDHFGEYTQRDMVTNNQQAVTMMTVEPGHPLHLLLALSRKFPRVRGKDIFLTYLGFLKILEDPTEEIVVEKAAKKYQSLRREETLRKDVVIPPQHQMPDEFICPISKQIMMKPVYVDNLDRRIDMKSMREWLKNSPTHPLTKAPITEEELKVDNIMQTRIFAFFDRFARVKY